MLFEDKQDWFEGPKKDCGKAVRKSLEQALMIDEVYEIYDGGDAEIGFLFIYCCAIRMVQQNTNLLSCNLCINVYLI